VAPQDSWETHCAVTHFRDTGIGIPMMRQDKIWARLYRGDKSRCRTRPRLGLSLVKAIVEGHRGQVAVTSKPDAGSDFTGHAAKIALMSGPQNTCNIIVGHHVLNDRMKTFRIGLACVALLITAMHSVADEFDSAGVKIHYAVRGEGEPVILIHGLYSSAG